VPLKPGTEVQAKVHSTYVEIWHEGRCVARHERCYSRRQQILNLEHYLDVLEKKPGALAGSKPLEQWRQSGRWPDSFDQLWAELMKRHGRQAGTRQMIELLTLGKEHGYGRLREAVESALDSGAHDVSAVRYLMTTTSSRIDVPAVDIGRLERYERPLPLTNEYDRLLSIGVTQ
jgi:hypothetical protein